MTRMPLWPPPYGHRLAFRFITATHMPQSFVIIACTAVP
jgi:hypothetical protein